MAMEMTEMETTEMISLIVAYLQCDEAKDNQLVIDLYNELKQLGFDELDDDTKQKIYLDSYEAQAEPKKKVNVCSDCGKITENPNVQCVECEQNDAT